MSIFDPYTLYRRTYKKTHKGQVIQQKPTEVHTPIIKQEIPRSLSVLKTFNYQIFPNDVSLYPQIITIPSSILYSTPKASPSGALIQYYTYETLFNQLRQEYPINLNSIGIDASNYQDLIESVNLQVDINDIEIFVSPGQNKQIQRVNYINVVNGWDCSTGTALQNTGALQATSFFVPKSSGLKFYCYPRQTTGEIIIDIDTLEDMTSPVSFYLEGMEILDYIFASSGSPQTGPIFQAQYSHENGTGGSSNFYASIDFHLNILPKPQTL